MELLFILLVLAAFIVSVIALISKRYKRCPSNRVLVIYGKVRTGGASKCIHGGAAFIIPLIQDYDYLSLEPIQIEIPLKDALSMENIRVAVPSVFTVAIGTEPQVMQNAAIRLLGLDTMQAKKQAEDIILGQLRQVIASMKIEDINRDREKFLHNIQDSLEPELRKIGLVLINVNITDITDSSGYIQAIGQKAAAQAVQQARGDVATEEKLGEIRVAEAEREKTVQVAENRKLQAIGIQTAEREQAVRIAELEKEKLVGEQAAAYEQEAQIKAREREMRISVAEANARAVEGENISKAAIADSEAALKVKEAEAYQLGATRSEEAKAAVLEAKNRALTKAALAEAERVEAERRAQLEAVAKAEKAKTIVEAEAEKEKRRLEAEGEASALFAKLEAEARGEYEILAKKGEGLKQIVEACGSADAAFKMLMLEHLDKLAETSAKAISNIKFDKVIVWENGNGKGSTANFLNNLTNTLPPMMQVMKDVGGVEFPEYFAKIARDADSNGEDKAPSHSPPAAASNPGHTDSPPASTGETRQPPQQPPAGKK